MKIIFLVKYNVGFIDDIVKKYDSSLSYKELHQWVLNESSIIFSSLVKIFNEMGHDAKMIVANFKPLQEKWCNENNVIIDEKWKFKIPQEQIKSEKPDILFLSSNFEYFGSFLSDIKPFVNKICTWISCPFEKDLNLNYIDHIFTLFKPHYEYFKKLGISTTLTHAAFDSDALKNINSIKKYDFTFIGGIGKYHKVREKYLKVLIKKTPIKIWGYGYVSKDPIKNILKQIKTGFVYNKVFQGEAYGTEMLNILAQSKITFNVHGDIAIGYSVNMRLFEATGVGTLLLTELTDDIINFFEPGKEVVCYKNVEDAIEKVNYYLNNPKEREEIARAGQIKTLNNYTYKHLAKDYINTFKLLLNNNEK